MINGATPLSNISIVVPVYNSAGTLLTLVDRIDAAVSARFPHYEIVLVDDGSGDSSWQVMEAIATSRGRIVALRLARNYGQHAALLAGLRAATNDVLVTIDDDLQNPPEEISKLYDFLQGGDYDLVYGTRAAERHGVLRNTLSRLTKWMLATTMSTQMARSVTAFRLLRRSLVDDLTHVDLPDAIIDVMLSWVTRNVGAIEVRHDARIAGRSNYSTLTLVRHAINLITGYSTLPLRIAAIAGLAFSVFGSIALAYVTIVYVIRGSVVPGFPFLASLVTIFSGVQLFSLGIFGEYLARLFTRSMGRPAYVVRARAGMSTDRSASEPIAQQPPSAR